MEKYNSQPFQQRNNKNFKLFLEKMATKTIFKIRKSSWVHKNVDCC